MAETIEWNNEWWQKAERDSYSRKKGDWICVWGWADVEKERRKEAYEEG